MKLDWFPKAFLALSLLLPMACSATPRHPLDDSESRPADLRSALIAANETLDDVEGSVLNGAVGQTSEWLPTSGCATSPDSPEQGDVSRILYRTHLQLPAGATSDTIISESRTRWERAGHTVGAGPPNSATQVITRIDGIGYSVVEITAGIELRAFLPCLEP